MMSSGSNSHGSCCLSSSDLRTFVGKVFALAHRVSAQVRGEAFFVMQAGLLPAEQKNKGNQRRFAPAIQVTDVCP